MTKICHMTSVHQSNDIRIFYKECVSLADAGYNVYLVAQGISRNECGITVIGIGEIPKSRHKRMFSFTKKIYDEALHIDADIYHFHDPELLPYSLKLKKRGKKVIYDSHEDVPRQILSKTWLPFLIRKPISKVYEIYEKHIAKKLDCVIAATPHIRSLFAGYGCTSIDICNFPTLSNQSFMNNNQKDKKVCYAGGLTEARGITTLVQAIKDTDCKLLLAGEMPKEYAETLSFYPGWNKTYLLGYLNRREIEKLYSESLLGLAMLKPTPNHLNSLAIKLFEYMAAGLPVVCSDFPLWKEIVEKNKCGICVNPENEDEIAKAINFISDNPEIARQMGENGHLVVQRLYNWETEALKLFQAYKDLLCYVVEGDVL